MEFYVIEHSLAIKNEVVEKFLLTDLYVSNLHVGQIIKLCTIQSYFGKIETRYLLYVYYMYLLYVYYMPRKMSKRIMCECLKCK